ncbi:hypothetical protein OG596_02030 [Streptomyces sp. NBC_01102]|uniref:hypothetical protein n=1 Tax=unclassified Streptomyces TaxID=2593676 RepID=UPI00386FE592|nr:hypothetical protein OG596_02030 [Streptomyces sp. NBC_01102]
MTGFMRAAARFFSLLSGKSIHRESRPARHHEQEVTSGRAWLTTLTTTYNLATHLIEQLFSFPPERIAEPIESRHTKE